MYVGCKFQVTPWSQFSGYRLHTTNKWTQMSTHRATARILFINTSLKIWDKKQEMSLTHPLDHIFKTETEKSKSDSFHVVSLSPDSGRRRGESGSSSSKTPTASCSRQATKLATTIPKICFIFSTRFNMTCAPEIGSEDVKSRAPELNL